MARMRPKIHCLLPILAIAALAGCATAPPPIQLMDRAQSEIRAARNAGAASSAPEALAEAERRLAAAQQFTMNGDNDKAAWSAEEAEAAAETARARAQAAALDRQIREQTAENQSLQADLQRRQAAAAAAQAAAAPPSASSSGAAPVNLPSIELGQPASGSSAAPASSSGSGVPTPGGTSGKPDPESGSMP